MKMTTAEKQPKLPSESTGAVNILGRFRAGVLWSLVAAVFNQGSTLVVNVFLANFFGRSGFGSYTMIQSTVAMVAMVAQFALGTTVSRYVSELRISDKSRAGSVLGFCALVAAASSLVASVGILAAAPLLAKLFRAQGLVEAFRLAAPLVLFAITTGVAMGALAGLEAYRAVAKVGIVAGCLYLVLGISGARAGGLEGALFGTAIANGIGCILYICGVRAAARAHGIEMTLAGSLDQRAILFVFALPAALNGMTHLPAIWFANVCLAKTLNGTDEVAFYGAANTCRVLVMFLPTLVSGVGSALLNQQRGARDDSGYRRVFWLNLAAVLGVVAVLAPATGLTAPLLLRAFGRDFSGGVGVLRILLISAIPEALVVCLYQVVQSHVRMWLSMFTITLPRDGLFVILSYCLAPRLGAAGIAIAYGAGWSLALLFVFFSVLRIGLGLEAPPRLSGNLSR